MHANLKISLGDLDKIVIAHIEPIIRKHGEVNMEAAAFTLVQENLNSLEDAIAVCCSRHVFLERIKHVAKKFATPDVKSPAFVQLEIPGFETLSAAYPVKRGDQHLLLIPSKMTVDELKAKVEQYKANRDTLSDHIETLERYIKFREEQEGSEAHP